MATKTYIEELQGEEYMYTYRRILVLTDFVDQTPAGPGVGNPHCIMIFSCNQNNIDMYNNPDIFR